jgi:hypothetical protein
MAAATARGTSDACIVAWPLSLARCRTLQAVRPGPPYQVVDREPRWHDGRGATEPAICPLGRSADNRQTTQTIPVAALGSYQQHEHGEPVRAPIPPHLKPPAAAQPRQRPLHPPAMPPQQLRRLDPTPSNPRPDPTPPQPGAVARAVIALVSVQLPRTDRAAGRAGSGRQCTSRGRGSSSVQGPRSSSPPPRRARHRRPTTRRLPLPSRFTPPMEPGRYDSPSDRRRSCGCTLTARVWICP